MSTITPTVGRIVWYRLALSQDEHGIDAKMARFNTQGEPRPDPLPAMIVGINTPERVNLVVFDAAGVAHPRASVLIAQDGDPVPVDGGYAEWMPFQLGQAAKVAAVASEKSSVPTIREGDLVQIKTGGPTMTAGERTDQGRVCNFYDSVSRQPMHWILPDACLVLQQPDPDVIAKARRAHEVNRAYQASAPEPGIPVAPPWDDFPADQQAGVIAGVRAALAGATPEQLHASWSAQKVAEGWVYGEVKDAAVKTHPCLVPYDQLPQAQRVKDFLFRAAVLN